MIRDGRGAGLHVTRDEFVEHAIAGGWRTSSLPQLSLVQRAVPRSTIEAEHETCWIWWAKMLLDETAWQSVGRSAGWHHKSWRKHMRLMGDAVVSGKSTEQFLATLET